MKRWLIAFALLLGAVFCSSGVEDVATPTVGETETPIPTLTQTSQPSLPPVVGEDPYYNVGVFYYPWYGNPEVDGEWIHWEEGNRNPPLDIGSPHYPVLGAYSSVDPNVVAQHFAWLRETGVGVIISSWWGQGTYEDKAVPTLLDAAERYGIKVAFHIEPYGGRSASSLVEDVEYLYEEYGDHPAFFRSTASSRWSPDDRAKGMFFVWLIEFRDSNSGRVEADYWLEAMDAIHALPDGGLVIANTTQGAWVDGGHFDGLYNYASLNSEPDFLWARSLPPDAWYVPSVVPGFAMRSSSSPFLPRLEGATYRNQWAAALGMEVEPHMVTITSFNEWHEGTQIEPAEPGAANGQGYAYMDYGLLPPDGYLLLTREQVGKFLMMTWPVTYRARIKITTTSDWTTFGLLSGGAWMRPNLVLVSEEADYAGMDGDWFVLLQPLSRAESGGSVEMVVDVLLTGLEPGGTLVFAIERGGLGSTTVELMNYLGATPSLVDTFWWGGNNLDERNTLTVETPASGLLGSSP